MADTIELSELKGDLKELETVLTTVNRSNVRNLIADAISSLKLKIDTLEASAAKKKEQSGEQKATKPTLYTAKITNYGWDESAKFVKLYITLPNIEKLTNEQVICDFTNTSFKCVVNNHNGKNHMLQVVKLAGSIIPSSSTCKVKSGNVVIALKKESEGNTWGHLTDAEKKVKEQKEAKLDANKDAESSDPQAGIMNLMKKMYDDGDDDMKRMIKKTWYESQQKQKTGENGGMPEMPGMSGMPGMPAF